MNKILTVIALSISALMMYGMWFAYALGCRLTGFDPIPVWGYILLCAISLVIGYGASRTGGAK